MYYKEIPHTQLMMIVSSKTLCCKVEYSVRLKRWFFRLFNQSMKSARLLIFFYLETSSGFNIDLYIFLYNVGL
jgi:hypothetical protein